VELILIRHGQSESNARLTMELDSRLTELGRRQADATAVYLTDRILRDPKAAQVFVSPFRRTLETCRPYALRAGVSAHAYPNMCEHFAADNAAYHSFDGLTADEIEQEFPFVVLDSILACDSRWWPAALEDVNAMYCRAERVRDTLLERYGSSDVQVVIFSHAEPIGRLVEAMQRVGPVQGWPPWSENCGVTRLLVHDPSKPAELVTINDVSHLQALGIVSPTNPVAVGAAGP
jgi:broad specificity phosphatase PhoE